MLERRIQLLAEVEKMAVQFGVPADAAYTCETAAHFWLLHVLSRWEKFRVGAASTLCMCSMPASLTCYQGKQCVGIAWICLLWCAFTPYQSCICRWIYGLYSQA